MNGTVSAAPHLYSAPCPASIDSRQDPWFDSIECEHDEINSEGVRRLDVGRIERMCVKVDSSSRR